MTAKRITDMTAGAALDGTELLEISQLSTSVTISAATISAAAADNSYNDSGSGFVAAGFAVGDRVRVEGFTGNVANNILIGIITALTTAKMTIGGTDGDVIVDDAAGETVTISKWATRRTTALEISELANAAGANLPEVATVSGTTYDVLATDSGKYLRFTSSSAKTVNVRPNATEALPDNGEWNLRNVGSSDLTLVEGSGVTINLPSGGTLVVPSGGTVTLKRVAVNEFDLFGLVTAA